MVDQVFDGLSLTQMFCPACRRPELEATIHHLYQHHCMSRPRGRPATPSHFSAPERLSRSLCRRHRFVKLFIYLRSTNLSTPATYCAENLNFEEIGQACLHDVRALLAEDGLAPTIFHFLPFKLEKTCRRATCSDEPKTSAAAHARPQSI